MKKGFEDCFTEIQKDMISICLEYANDKADVVYVYASCEGRVISSDFFYKINSQIWARHKLNEIDPNEYDVSRSRQGACLDILIEDIEKLRDVCQEYDQPMPTEIKLIYDVNSHKVDARYRYDNVYTQSKTKTADDVAEEWFKEEKKKLEQAGNHNG